MTKLRHIIMAVLSSGLLLLLSGCKAAVLDHKGIIALDEKHLLIDAVLLMLIVVVPVIILTFAFAWRYRASNINAKYDPEWSHNVLLEIVWWTIPCIIIAILATLTWISSHRLDPYRPLNVQGKPITIQAIALDWKWLFIYPDQHIATVNYVQLPVNVPVRFLITSDGPMNSLLIPQIAGQIYAMAGMQTKLNVMATTLGDYRGLSANYSGEGFAYMNFMTRATTQAQFKQWVQSVQKSHKKLDLTTFNKLTQPSKDNPVEYYSVVTNYLFNYEMMKFMMPMKDIKNMKDMPDMTGSSNTSSSMSSNMANMPGMNMNDSKEMNAKMEMKKQQDIKAKKRLYRR